MGQREELERQNQVMLDELSNYELLGRRHTHEVRMFEGEVELARDELREAQRQNEQLQQGSAGMEELLQRLARAEIDFHSRRLEAPPAEQTTRQAKATHDLWNRRGRETNPGVMEGGLTVEGRALTRVAWLYFRQAPRISPRESRERAERWLFFRQASEVLRQRRAAAEASTRRASGLGSGGGPNLELLRLEYQSLVSAANMTRKLDEEAAVAEYSEIQTSAVLLEHAGADEGLRKVLSEARRHLAKAEEMQREAQARHTLAHSLPSAPSSRALRASSVAEPRLPGPLSLTLSPLRPGAIGLAHEAGKASYRVGLESAALSRVAEHGLAAFGRITPLHPVAAGEGAWAAAAPAEATLFAWAFPLAGARGTGLVPQSDEERFVVFGGFVYFDGLSRVCGVRAASPGVGLAFDGPNSLLDELSHGARVREVLLERGLCNPASLPSLRDCGVDEHWWLAPGQQIADEDGSAWPHGAFVCLYAEPSAHLDCFFACRPPS